MPVATSTAPTHKRRFEVEKFHSDEGLVVISTHNMPSQKQARGGTSNGISEAKVSVIGVSHKPAARIPKSKIKNEPKEAGCGEERLTTQNAQGICHQSFLGPSFQRHWAAEDTRGQLIWIEGSVEEDAVYHIGSTAQQQQREEAKG
jgi:hypothetical protein